MDVAKAKHGAVLSTWAEDHGKKRNVRTLLSTMHTVRAARAWGDGLMDGWVYGLIDWFMDCWIGLWVWMCVVWMYFFQSCFVSSACFNAVALAYFFYSLCCLNVVFDNLPGIYIYLYFVFQTCFVSWACFDFCFRQLCLLTVDLLGLLKWNFF